MFEENEEESTLLMDVPTGFSSYSQAEARQVAPTPPPVPQVPPVATAPVRAVPEPTQEDLNNTPAGFSFYSKEELPVEEPTVEGTKSFADIMASPSDLNVVRKFMTRVKGTDYNTKPDEEAVTDFMAHMRWAGANELSTLSEVYDIYNLDDAGKVDYANAYRLFDETGNIFTTGTWGDLGSGVSDYALSVATSPSTFLTFGFGKMVGAAGSKAAQKTAIDTVLKGAASKGLSEAATAKVERDVVSYFSRRNAIKATTMAGIAETTIAATQDYAYQHGKVKLGVQDEYSALQTALTVGLVAPLALAPALTATRRGTGSQGISGLGNVDEGIQKSREKVTKNLDNVVTTKIAPNLNKKAVEWEKLLKGSTLQDPNREVRDQMVRYFFDLEDPESFISQIIPVGARLDRSGGQTLTHALVEVGEGLSPAAREALDGSLARLDVTYTDFIQAVAKTMNEGGVNANLASQAARALDNLMAKGNANSSAYKNILEATRDAKPLKPKDVPQVASYLQSLWKRSLVSNIGTTMINVKGWGLAEVGSTMAQLLQSATMFGVAGVNALMGKDAGPALGRSKALFMNMGYATRQLADPFTTYDAFKQLVQEVAPRDIRDRLSHQFIQGIDNRGAEAFNIKPSSKLGKASKVAEGYVRLGQKMTLVNFQDVMTKSFSGMKELDKQSRLQMKMSLPEALRTGRIHELSHTAWEAMVKALQDNTFSRDYSRGNGVLNKLADFSQRASNLPGVGLIYPFGRFVNSVVGFTYTYSPLALAVIGAKLTTKNVKAAVGKGAASTIDDFDDEFFKAVFGTGALLTMMQHDKEKMEEGLQWFEERDDSGEVYKVDNLFPYSIFALAARYWNHGDPADKDLLKDMSRQLILPAALQDLTKAGDPQALSAVADLLDFVMPTDVEETDTDISKSLSGLLAGVSSGVANIASGFTRPLDTLNDGLGLYGDIQGWNNIDDIDRKQLRGWDRVGPEFFRYTDSIFKYLGGGNEGERGRELGPSKFSATQVGPKRSGDPLSALTGRNVDQRRTNIDKVLGMASFPPFKADSFSTGVPEYDNWLNEVVAPTLEFRATVLLQNKVFKEGSHKIKKEMVGQMIKDARNEVLKELTAPSNPDKRGPVFKLRRDILTTPESMREMALQQLGWKGREMEDFSLYELEVIMSTIDLTKKKYKDASAIK